MQLIWLNGRRWLSYLKYQKLNEKQKKKNEREKTKLQNKL